MRNVVLTGGNRGLGLEFVKQIIAGGATEHLFAACRDPASAKLLFCQDLQDVAKSSGKTTVHVEKLDISDEKQATELAARVSSVVGDAGVNVLINNAAVLERADTLNDLDADAFTNSFRTNTLGPLFMTRAFLPLLKKAADNEKDQPLSAKRACVVNVSTKVASIDDNTSGKNYYYRVTKTALNMGTRNLCHELGPQGILVLLLHPGWVRTRMGGSQGLIDEPESVSGLLARITGATEADACVFYDYKGDRIKW